MGGVVVVRAECDRIPIRCRCRNAANEQRARRAGCRGAGHLQQVAPALRPIGMAIPVVARGGRCLQRIESRGQGLHLGAQLGDEIRLTAGDFLRSSHQ